jgi:hypothetical protein
MAAIYYTYLQRAHGAVDVCIGPAYVQLRVLL